MTLLNVLAAGLCLGSPAHAGDVGETLLYRGAAAAFSAGIVPAPGRVVFDTGVSDAPAEPYDSVLAQGVMPDPGVRLEASRPGASGEDAAWRPMQVKRFEDGRFWARARFSRVSREPMRLRAVDDGIRRGHVLEIYDIELFIEGTGSDVQARGRAGEEPAPAPVGYELVKRADWKAAPAVKPYSPHVPVKLTLHHTAGRRPASSEEALREMRFIQDYHINGRKWIDVGYHFVISPDGRVFEGRPEKVLGAHVANDNTGNVGVSFMGNFHPPKDDRPGEPALKAFVALAKRLTRDYKIPVSRLLGHRDRGDTQCPGDILYQRLPELRKLIEAPPSPVGVAGLRKDLAARGLLSPPRWD